MNIAGLTSITMEVILYCVARERIVRWIDSSGVVARRSVVGQGTSNVRPIVSMVWNDLILVALAVAMVMLIVPKDVHLD